MQNCQDNDAFCFICLISLMLQIVHLLLHAHLSYLPKPTEASGNVAHLSGICDDILFAVRLLRFS